MSILQPISIYSQTDSFYRIQCPSSAEIRSTPRLLRTATTSMFSVPHSPLPPYHKQISARRKPRLATQSLAPPPLSHTHRHSRRSAHFGYKPQARLPAPRPVPRRMHTVRTTVTRHHAAVDRVHYTWARLSYTLIQWHRDAASLCCRKHICNICT